MKCQSKFSGKKKSCKKKSIELSSAESSKGYIHVLRYLNSSPFSTLHAAAIKERMKPQDTMYTCCTVNSLMNNNSLKNNIKESYQNIYQVPL